MLNNECESIYLTILKYISILRIKEIGTTVTSNKIKIDKDNKDVLFHFPLKHFL